MVALHGGNVAFAEQRNALARIRAVAHDIPQTENTFTFLSGDVGQHGLKSFEVGVYVRDDGGLHGGMGSLLLF